MGYSGEKGGIPRVVKDAAHYLRDTGNHLPALMSENKNCLRFFNSKGWKMWVFSGVRLHQSCCVRLRRPTTGATSFRWPRLATPISLPC